MAQLGLLLRFNPGRWPREQTSGYPRLRRPKAATRVEVPGWCPKHRSAVGSSVTVRRSRAPRGQRRRMHGKGPCGQKASRAVQAVSFHRGGRGSGLGGSRAAWLRSPSGWRSRNGRRLAPPRRYNERRDRDVRGSIASSPWEEHTHASGTDSRWSRSDVDPPKRSGWREPPLPSSQPARLPGVESDARSARGVALGSTRDEGQRLEGIGWQRLVRGILLGHASSASSGHELG